MGLEIDGVSELSQDIMDLARQADDGSVYFRNMVKRALGAGGEIIAGQIRENAARARDTGTIFRSVGVSGVVRHRRGGYTIKIGVQRSTEGAYYAGPLEFGHGGPHGPAAPHPFVRPAYDAKSDEAYQKIRQELEILLFEKLNS